MLQLINNNADNVHFIFKLLFLIFLSIYLRILNTKQLENNKKSSS